MSLCQALARSTCLPALLFAGAASAWQLDYSLEAALGHSDNINQSATDPVAQSILIPRIDFDFKEEGAALEARAIGQVEYRDYLGNAFSNEVRGQLAGIATWMILPHRLNFDIEDYAAVQPVNILAPNSPGNQQQTNVFTLGPTFNFRLWQTLNGQAELRFTNSTASETKQFNSDRGMAALRAIRQLNPTDALSGNIQAQHVHFTDRTGGPDYDRVDGFLRYQSKLSELDLDVAAGYSTLDLSGVGDHSGPMAHAIATWRATPRNTLKVGAVRQFSDASQDMIIDPAALVATMLGTGVVVGTTTVNSDVYLEKRFDASHVFQTERWQTRIAPYHKTLDYLIDPGLEQRIHGVVAGVSYRPRPLWTIAFDATEETRDYPRLDRRDEDLRYDLSFLDQLARHWSVRVDLIRNERNSTAPDQGFRENVFFCTLIFRR